jgi:hypothetical protein
MTYIYLLMQNHNGEKDSVLGAYSTYSNASDAISAFVDVEGHNREELFIVAVQWQPYPKEETNETLA